MSTAEQLETTLDTLQSIVIDATLEEAYKGLLYRLSEGNSTPDGKPLQLVLEPWPGGRWFRDLGKDANGNEQGHLWGFVQVIKPPTLLEFQGPLFMSYPVAGHIVFRLEENEESDGGGVELSVHHRAIGMIQEEHRQGVVPGWASILEKVKNQCEEKNKK